MHDVCEKGMDLVPVEKAAELTWESEPNPHGEPLDYEDKWGKANAANYAFKVPNQGLSFAKEQKLAVSPKSGDTTFEVWLREGQHTDMLILSLLSDGSNLTLLIVREQG